MTLFLLCAGSACLLGIGTLPATAGKLAFFRSEMSDKISGRTLTFAERLAYQYAIEEVYWRHRIWPKDNPGSKPSLDEVMSRQQVEKKVNDYLHTSQLLLEHWKQPITAGQLQAEMDRMAHHTKQPEVLRQLFAALGDDPFVIAECLVRPALAERLVSELSEHDGMEAFVLAAGSNPIPQLYKLPEIAPLDCADDTWTTTTTVNVPDAREFHTAVWTGSEMIVWGGFNSSPPYFFNTGGRYTPATDSWTRTNTINAPTARDFHTAAWTGSEMIVWGGGGNELVNTGGRYDPTNDSWTPTSTANAPAPRVAHTAVWSGTDMIVWGGRNNVLWMNSGGQYNPSTDSWTATSTTNAPEARWAHTVEWTGSEMIVWGGTNQTIYLNTGGRYNPSNNSWTATSTATAPLGRVGHTAIWTGSQMSVWGGTDSTFNDTNTGGAYDPSSNSWTATSTANAPSARDSHTAVWTGSEMIVWGGVFCCPAIDFDTGGRYDNGTDSWTATSTAGAPLRRYAQTAVWTGSEMIIWGGYNVESGMQLNTGGRYCFQSAATPTPTPTPMTTATPSPTPTPTPTPTSTLTPTATPRATPTPRIAPTPRVRPTPRPRP